DDLSGRLRVPTSPSLAALSPDPPTAGISMPQQASLHGLLRDAGEWGGSMLSGDQEELAQHFARSVPPIALWNGIDVREDDPRLLEGAAGWFVARTVAEHRTGDHTFFVGQVQSVEEGNAADSLTYVHRSYKRV